MTQIHEKHKPPLSVVVHNIRHDIATATESVTARLHHNVHGYTAEEINAAMGPDAAAAVATHLSSGETAATTLEPAAVAAAVAKVQAAQKATPTVPAAPVTPVAPPV